MMLLTLALWVVTPPTPAFWGPMGHRLVVQLAWGRLTPRARSTAKALLGGEPPEDAALWADQIRGERRETAPLHYVNIPLGATAYDPGRDCPRDQCIITAIGSYRTRLADTNASQGTRAEALRFLLHFMADLHQPLHVSNHDDRGGNEVKVTWQGRETNLHALWDTDLPRSWAVDEEDYLKGLRRSTNRMSRARRDAAAAGSVIEWAMEGNRQATDVAYGARRSGNPGRDYLEAAGPVIDQAMIEAGLRLARMLNEALDPDGTK
jgi:hypothetical protein